MTFTKTPRNLVPQRPSERTDDALKAALLRNQRAVALLTWREEARLKDFILTTLFGKSEIPDIDQYINALLIKSPSLRHSVLKTHFGALEETAAKARTTLRCLRTSPGDVLKLTEVDGYTLAADICDAMETFPCGFVGLHFQTAAQAEIFYKFHRRFDLIPTHLQTESMCYAAIEQDPADFQYIGLVKAPMIDALIAKVGWPNALVWMPRDLDVNQVLDLDEGLKNRILGGWAEMDKMAAEKAAALKKAEDDTLRKTLSDLFQPTNADRLIELLPPGIKIVRTRAAAPKVKRVGTRAKKTMEMGAKA